jgi:hypothetical protein
MNREKLQNPASTGRLPGACLSDQRVNTGWKCKKMPLNAYKSAFPLKPFMENPNCTLRLYCQAGE